MSLLTVPVMDLLELWGELVECYYNHNGYGGDTAEIYGYRLGGDSPTLAAWKGKGGFDEFAIEELTTRMNALKELCALFSDKFNRGVYINGARACEFRDAEAMAHRVHVKIERAL